MAKKNPHAVALGRKGGKKGGKVTASRMTAEERVAATKHAAAHRWAGKTAEEKRAHAMRMVRARKRVKRSAP